tara:strand:+ start:194 stop:346 length:153 start_codon:yes stop_codon:yes gene_type:complete
MTEKKDVIVKVKGLAFNLTNKPEEKKDEHTSNDNDKKDSAEKKESTHGKT